MLLYILILKNSHFIYINFSFNKPSVFYMISDALHIYQIYYRGFMVKQRSSEK